MKHCFDFVLISYLTKITNLIEYNSFIAFLLNSRILRYYRTSIKQGLKFSKVHYLIIYLLSADLVSNSMLLYSVSFHGLMLFLKVPQFDCWSQIKMQYIVSSLETKTPQHSPKS